MITESDLQRIFSACGPVTGVCLKDRHVDERSGRQNGLGFVHFGSSTDGMHAAFRAVSSMDGNTVNGIVFRVELSRNLLRQFGTDAEGIPTATPGSPRGDCGQRHEARSDIGAPAVPPPKALIPYQYPNPSLYGNAAPTDRSLHPMDQFFECARNCGEMSTRSYLQQAADRGNELRHLHQPPNAAACVLACGGERNTAHAHAFLGRRSHYRGFQCF